ncbi:MULTISPECIES: YecA family protein [Burkholderia]|uniref:YecA family protein n=1 Tax=Burkholderia TaxID=32008 RepID=UPI00064EFDB3|nr:MULTISPECIES: SEC-C metal-binding domain-containing protein [Burkholderia]KML15962.1 hypothetical protein VL00_13790 [Burkholderia cepacia]KML42215.1 hypothetical protein VL13_11080 [Burkholderia lata]KMN62261.1 hypothetical protein VK92_02855 [Burkholderia sp. LK4]
MASADSNGVTPTEQLLAEFCERSFLKLWSYPNPFKDDGHELCDLLAVFENHVFIFFDRQNQYRDTADTDALIAWNRWRRSVIDKQVKTAHGAERYIRSGRAIFTDRKCAKPFPVAIDPTHAIVHKIVVAHGAKSACKAFSEDNVYGSLAVTYADDADGPEYPFFINLDRKNPVHVFDSHNLPIVLRELDTVSDFTAYLDEKTAAIRDFDMLSYCGEEDLLAHYLLNYDKARQRHFIGDLERKLHGVGIGEGGWFGFEQSNLYRDTKAADRISYMWDELIQRTCQNYLDGVLLGDAELLRQPNAIHEMAKEPRFIRRVLAERLRAAIRSFPVIGSDSITRQVTLIPSYDRSKAYVFLQLRVPPEIRGDEEEYRGKRRRILEIACGAAKNKCPQYTTIVGIAIDAPKFHTSNAEDFLLMRCTDWPEARRAQYEQDNVGWNFFCSPSLTMHRQTTTEFVTREKPSARRTVAKVGRNTICPCGSQRKFKHCCGR